MYIKRGELPYSLKHLVGKTVRCTKTWCRYYNVGDVRVIERSESGFARLSGRGNGHSAEWELVEEAPFNLNNYL